MITMRKTLLLIMCCFAAIITACGPDEPDVIEVTNVTISPQGDFSLTEGQTKTLTAKVTPTNATDPEITWSSTSPSVATVENGIVKAIAPGEATISAKASNGIMAKINVTVTAKPSGNIEAQDITLDLSEDFELTIGDSTTIVATVLPENTTDKTVTWESNNTHIATVVDGKVIALQVGEAEITATTHNGLYTFVKVTVTPIKPTSVKIHPEGNFSLTMGGGKQLSAKVLPENATDTIATWTSSDENIATVDSEGFVLAKNQGKATITATIGELKDQVEVTVGGVAAISIEIDPSNDFELQEGDTRTLTVKAKPSAAVVEGVVWSSSDESIAEVNEGIVTAKKKGVANITATMGELTASVKATIVTEGAEWFAADFTATNYPEGDTWTIADDNGNDSDFLNGINAALKSVKKENTHEVITLIFPNVPEVLGYLEKDDKLIPKIRVSAPMIRTLNYPFDTPALIWLSIPNVSYFEAKQNYFVNCLNLEEIILNPDYFIIEDGIIYSVDKTSLVAYFRSNTATSFIIPNSVTEIYRNAFDYNEHLTAIEATNITEIGEYAIMNLPNLKSVKLPRVENISGIYVFRGCPIENMELATKVRYSGSLGWTTYGTTVEDIILTTNIVNASANRLTTSASDKESEPFKAITTVNDPIETLIKSVDITEDLIYINAGKSHTLEAIIDPTDAPNKNLIWWSEDEKIATVDDKGKVTGVSEGYTRIFVKTQDGGKVDQCQVTVWPPIVVESVKLDKTSLEMNEGDTHTLTATVYPKEVDNKEVTWSSSNKEVATVDNSGKVTAIKEGNATITVTTVENKKTANCEITVINPNGVESVSLDQTSLEMNEGDTHTLKATVYPEEADNKEVTWSSSNKEVATVDNSGKVTAIKEGNATITVTTVENKKTANCEITVTVPAAVEGIKLDINTLSISLEETTPRTIGYTITPKNAENKNVTWGSSNSAVVTVSEGGEINIASGATAGQSATITVTTVDGGYTDDCMITVVESFSERDILMAFYNATNGDSWTDNTNWGSEKPIGEWFGVTVNSSGSVTELDLIVNNLSGTIPIEIGNLSSLTLLSLTKNKIIGSIPIEIGKLTNLTTLNLGSNQLSGSIPIEIGELTNLQSLYLYNNNLSGSIPIEIGKLTKLTNLSFRNNLLTGLIPTEIGKLTKLTDIYLYNNQLTGNLPAEIGNIPELENFRVDGNNLNGTIPDEIKNHKNYGTENWIFNPQNDGYGFDLEDNDQVKADKAALMALYNATGGENWTDNTKWGNENAPLSEWHGIATDSYGRVTEIKLHKNNLIGTIPKEIGNLTKLTRLDLYNNQLSGNIPAEIGNLTNLTTLYLYTNQLSGTIPKEIGNLTNLTSLYLSVNQLAGTIPAEIEKLTNLTQLSLENNQLSGSIPAEVGKLTNLTWLNLSINQLTGSIPAEIGNLTNLDYLSCGGNMLTGTIPVEIGKLTNLTGLRLYRNQLSGSIPAEIGNLTKLTRLDLYNNQLSGNIPAEIGNIPELKNFRVDGNNLSGTIPDAIKNHKNYTFGIFTPEGENPKWIFNPQNDGYGLTE